MSCTDITKQWGRLKTKENTSDQYAAAPFEEFRHGKSEKWDFKISDLLKQRIFQQFLQGTILCLLFPDFLLYVEIISSIPKNHL